jgi:hypothetical protein
MEQFFPDKVLPDHAWLNIVDNAHPKVHYRLYHTLKLHGWTVPRIDDLDFDDSDRVEKKEWTRYTPIWVARACSESGLSQMARHNRRKILSADWWTALVEKGHPALSFRIYHLLKKNGWTVTAIDDPGFD